MSSKRRNTSSPECEVPAKRQQADIVPPSPSFDGSYDEPDPVEVYEKPQLDAYTGQAGAFPGLGKHEDDIFYGPAHDGIDYLRMVRSEAKDIPTLLRSNADDHGWDDEDYDVMNGGDEDGGYWDEDGTYTAKPLAQVDDSRIQYPRAQIEYYNSLLAHFALVRATLKCIPPLSAIEQLTSSQPISFPSENKNARALWLQCLRTRHPTPTQISCMDQDSVLTLIRLIITKMRRLFEKRDTASAQRTGAWIWAALGKCADRGELGSEEVSDLRRLAQKATDVRAWLEKGARQISTNDIDEGSTSDEDAQSNAETGEDLNLAIETAKQRLLEVESEGIGKLHSTVGRTEECDGTADNFGGSAAKILEAKIIVLDMILTVVGETYGQRDLLELRPLWTADTHLSM